MDEPNKRIRLNVSVDPELHLELRRLSVDTGRPLTELVPSLLRQAAYQERVRLENLPSARGKAPKQP